MRVNKRYIHVGLAMLLAGCGSMSTDKLWPFGDSSSGGKSYVPPNATEYQCNGGKRFFVRMLDNGATAWLILPDREVGLAKASSGNRYSNGIAVLEINGGEASLTDGTVSYSGCKVPAPAATK